MPVSRTRWNVIGFCISCVLVVGCGKNDPSPAPGPDPVRPDSPPATETPNVDAPPTSPAKTSTKSGTDDETDDGITLKTLDWEATQRLIAGHKGKVVVVDFWSTSCVPCIKEFPHLVALHKKHEGQVACVSVNCDYYGNKDEPPEFYREDVLRLLRKKGASFDNVLSSVADEDLFAKLGLPSVSLPVVHVYGRDGKLKKRFDNEEELYGEEGFTYQKDIVPFVEKLLDEAGQEGR